MSFRFLISYFFFCFETLDNLTSRYYEAVGGFFGASERGADSTSFEGGNKSGRLINRSCLVSIRLPARYQGLRPAFARSLCNGRESGDGRIQPIGALKRKHPAWVLRRKRTYFV